MDNPIRTALADEPYTAYVAGDSGPSAGPGACAYRIISPNGEVTEETVRSRDTMSNRALIGGAIAALKATPKEAAMTIKSDQDHLIGNCEKHLQGWVENNWLNSRGKPIKNDELWKQLAELMEGRVVTFRRVEGGDDDINNQEVKALARKGAEEADTRRMASLKRKR